jgi:DNA topoisomerase-1
LTEAPLADGDGNPSVIRFSRKTKEQYVMSEVDGKATGWTAYFVGSSWQVSDKATKPKTAAAKAKPKAKTTAKAKPKAKAKAKPKVKAPVAE